MRDTPQKDLQRETLVDALALRTRAARKERDWVLKKKKKKKTARLPLAAPLRHLACRYAKTLPLAYLLARDEACLPASGRGVVDLDSISFVEMFGNQTGWSRRSNVRTFYRERERERESSPKRVSVGSLHHQKTLEIVSHLSETETRERERERPWVQVLSSRKTRLSGAGAAGEAVGPPRAPRRSRPFVVSFLSVLRTCLLGWEKRKGAREDPFRARAPTGRVEGFGRPRRRSRVEGGSARGAALLCDSRRSAGGRR